MSSASTPFLPEALISRAQQLLDNKPCSILGITGAPGSGKSTLAKALATKLGPAVCYLPMDGFHLANEELDRLGLQERKGAADTFDALGYLNILDRIRGNSSGHSIYAPDFNREIEEPVAGSISIPPSTRLVVTEGNYLLLEEEPWRRVASRLDDVWFIAVDQSLQIERLVQRHKSFGKSPEHAAQWVNTVDMNNSIMIEKTRSKARWSVVSSENGFSPA